MHPSVSRLFCAITVLTGSACERVGHSLEADVASLCAPFGNRSVHLILLDPEECTSCDANIRALLANHRRAPQEWPVILTRLPTSHERRQLRLSRVLPTELATATATIERMHRGHSRLIECRPTASAVGGG